jgi:hypothetical protein
MGLKRTIGPPFFFFVLLVFDTVSWQKVNKRYAFHPFLFDEPKTLNLIFYVAPIFIEL